MSTSTNSAFIRAYNDAASTNTVANQTDRFDYVQNLVVSQLPDEQVKTTTEPMSGSSAVGAVTLADAAATEMAQRHRVDGMDTVMPPRPHFTVQEATVQEAMVQEAMAQETMVQETMVQETMVQETTVREAAFQDVPVTIEVAEEPVAMTPVAEPENVPAETGQQLNHFLATSKVASAPHTVRLRPQWEVDRFEWSAVSERLRSGSPNRMVDVVQGLSAQAQAGSRQVAVTSYKCGEGRTTFALNLARQAADAGLEVAVFDADLDNPQIARFTGVAFGTGWNNLEASKSIGEAGIVSVADRFAIFPYVPTPTQVPERMIRERGRKVLEQLTQSFEMVIIDVGPIFTAAHRWFRTDEKPVADSALVVRDVRSTEVQHVDDVCCRLIEVGIQNMAIIENFQTMQ